MFYDVCMYTSVYIFYAQSIYFCICFESIDHVELISAHSSVCDDCL